MINFHKKTIVHDYEEEEEEENDEILVLTNYKCKNCGANLKINSKDNKCICEYCGTEYYFDQYGIFKGQMVDLFIHGEHKKFYISEDYFNNIFSNVERDINGKLKATKVATKEKITLIEI